MCIYICTQYYSPLKRCRRRTTRDEHTASTAGRRSQSRTCTYLCTGHVQEGGVTVTLLCTTHVKEEASRHMPTAHVKRSHVPLHNTCHGKRHVTLQTYVKKMRHVTLQSTRQEQASRYSAQHMPRGGVTLLCTTYAKWRRHVL